MQLFFNVFFKNKEDFKKAIDNTDNPVYNILATVFVVLILQDSGALYMILNIKEIFLTPGLSRSFAFDIPLRDIGLDSDEAAKITGTVSNRSEIVTLRFSAHLVALLACDRCLTSFELNRSYDFTHILVQELHSEDSDEFIPVPDYKLDVYELCRTDLALEVPIKILCKEDCKGLCDRCGKNRNESSCDCGHGEIDPRLSALSELLK